MRGGLFSLILGIFVSTSEGEVLDPEAIIKITYEHNPRIAAARHKLRSAEYNYRLFESEYSQFTPFILGSSLEKSSGRNLSGRLTVGVRKEFFDGSSVSLNLGNEAEWSAESLENEQFLEARLEFPLFSSNRKLSRIIKRTFEENELYGARLGYVEQVRWVIRGALEEYYDLICRSKILEVLKGYKAQLESLLVERWVKDHPSEGEQIRDEISSLDSEIKGWEVVVSSKKVQLQRKMGLESLEGYRIEPVPLGLGEDDYYGRHYVEESYEEVIRRAIANDVEIKVLKSVMKAAEEKKLLAEKGKWDIFASVGGQYSYEGSDGGRDYSFSVGLNIKRFDRSVLNYSLLKAEEDILNVRARIRDRELEIAARIRQEKGEAENRRRQLESLYGSLKSRERMYRIKLERYLKGEEAVDNLIQAFRSLLETHVRCYRVGNDYLDNIRDLDFLCGVYFGKLGMEFGTR